MKTVTVASVIFAAGLAVSASGPQPFILWFSETALILIAAIVFAFTFRRFQFTNLTYILFLAFALVVFEGARYTYALAPIGEWMRSAFGFQRNHFDRVGHLMQGVAPAIVMRELLIRRVSFPRGKGLFWIVCGLSLGMAAVFELLEWQYALVRRGPVVDDLGAQGDIWDAQADMFMALVGAIGAQLALSRVHDRQLGYKRPVELRDRIDAEQLQSSHYIAS